MWRAVSLLTASAAFTIHWANAQTQDEAGLAPVQLEKVTIYGRAALQQRFLATGSLVVIDRKDIEQMGADSAGDVLRQMPGVQVNMGSSGSLEIRMRGMGAHATQILIDGERLGASRRGSQLPLDQLPADAIERIEVVRAPTAEQTGAAGGTINIVLRKATSKRETSIRFTDQHVWSKNGLQAFFSQTGPLNAADSKEAALPWTYFLAASSSTRLAGSDVSRKELVQGGAPSSSEAFEASRYRIQENVLVPRLSGRIGQKDQISMRAFLLDGHNKGRFNGLASGNDSTGSVSGRYVEESKVDRSRLQLGGDWAHHFEGAKLDVGFSMQRGSERIERQTSYLSTTSLGDTLTSSQLVDDRADRGLTITSKVTGTEGPLLWAFGAEVEERRQAVVTDQVITPPGTTSTLDLAVVERRGAVWAQNEWELPADTTLTAGLRAEGQSTTSIVAGADSRMRSSFLQPSVHTRTPIGKSSQARFNLARVTRKPALLDMIDRRLPSQGANSPANADFAGNPALRAESTLTLDAGIDWQLSNQGQIGLNIFVRQIHDVLNQRVSEESGRWVQRPENVGDATAWGIEGDLRTDLGSFGLSRDWSVSANASLLQSRIRNGELQGSRIPGQARYVVNLGLSKPAPMKGGGWFGGTSLSATGASDRRTSADATGRDRGYVTLDAHVGSVVAGLGYWRISVNNITDSKRERYLSQSDGAGDRHSVQSSMVLTPRFFATIGTRF